MITFVFIPFLALFGSNWPIDYLPQLQNNSHRATQERALPYTPELVRVATGTATSSHSSKRSDMRTIVAPRPKPVATSSPNVGIEPVITPKPSTTSSITPPASFAQELEKAVHAAINNERQAKSLNALTFEPKLADIARAHSIDMANNTYFDHKDPSGCSASCRLDRAGYSYRAMAENIFMTTNHPQEVASMAETIVEGWMESPGHRANILQEEYTNEGIGVAVHGNKVYTTELFATPR